MAKGPPHAKSKGAAGPPCRLPAHGEKAVGGRGCQHMTKEVCWRAAVRSVGRLPLLQNGRHGSVSFVDGETEQHGKERIGDVIGVTAGLWVASNRDSDRK